VVLDHTLEIGFAIGFMGSSFMLANHLDLLGLRCHLYPPWLVVLAVEENSGVGLDMQSKVASRETGVISRV
jgi:hypothetical protein